MSKTKNILWFSEVGKNDGATVGGKGGNLGEMYNAGLPVPNGYILTAQAYFKFLEASGVKDDIEKILKDFDPEDTKDLQKRAAQSQKIIQEAKMPENIKQEIIENYHELKKVTKSDKLYVAVRSSATAEDLAGASFAGQQATYLNVIGDEEVVKAVQKCWASLFEARTIYYRQEKGFGQLEVGIAVPIQKMVNSEKAGVMFTIDPTNNDLNHISIEAAFGLGEVVVLGAQTPDRYLVDKKTLEVTEKEINSQDWMLTRESGASDTDNTNDLEKHSVPVPEEKKKAQKLTDAEILELAKLALKIEEHYGKPQDTEWAIEAGKVYMVQSRPVTTLGEAQKQETENMKQETPAGQSVSDAEVILKGAAASSGMAFGPAVVIHSPEDIDKIKEGDVLVTEMTTPDYVPAMKRATAIVTDKGGRTSHAAIVSRELGIPCVVGTDTATTTLKDIGVITVDGAKGVIYKGQIAAPKQEESQVAQIQGTPAPITATKIYVNLGEPELAEKIAKQDVDGVGLLRAEFMISEIGVHPQKMIKEGRQEEFIKKLQEGLETFAQAFYPRPVIYRATDFKTNEYRNLKGGEEFEPQEENPMIGYRGAFRYIKNPEEFKMELEAIKRVRQNLNNLHLMIPVVRTVEEFGKVRKIIEDFGLLRDKDFKLWIMAEVPSIYFLLEDYIALGIDGVSIGSNDLTQMTLGLDRDSGLVAELFDERNKAVMESMRHIIETCKTGGVTCSICGQAPSVYPEVAEKLVEYGITSISVNPDVIDQTRRLVAQVEEKLLLKGLGEVREELAEVEEKLKENEKQDL